MGLVRRHEADLKVAELRMLWLALIVKKMNIIKICKPREQQMWNGEGGRENPG